MNCPPAKRFYVYVLLDPRKIGPFQYGKYQFNFQPFYVGKGKGKRWTSHLRLNEGSQQKNRRISEIVHSGSEIEVRYIFETDDEASAYTEESAAIKTIGRFNGPTEEPLLNSNDGWNGELFRFFQMIKEP